MSIYKCTEFQGSSGQWYCNDVSNLVKGSGSWWHAARACNLSPAAYIEMLIRDFNPDNISYNSDKNVLVFSFNSQVNLRKYKNWINAQARKHNYQI